MATPSLWIDGKRVPPSDFGTYGFGYLNDSKQSPEAFTSAKNWIIGVVISLAIVCAISAIINCLTKRNRGPAKARHIEAVTVERFLNNMAEEKPTRFSPSQLSDFTKNYSTILGSGGFGVVYRGQLPNGVPLAIKVLNGNLGKRAEEQFMAEISTIGRTYHVNLVKLYGFCFDPTKQALVYEYMENGSLDSFLFGKEKRRSSMEWEKLHKIAIGTAKGIAYLHEDCQHRIIHYDIKPGNVLLDSKLCPKVADFGLAKLCNRDSTHVTMTCYRGTPGYAAPELWMPFPVTHKCDVYSFGMLLFEIVGRRRNFNPNVSESKEWLPRWTWEKYEKGELMELMELFGIEEEEDKR
ncbi:putative serine/threonine-protein kinase [Telopea speciosissima]|uniref:putative serine/threonine-protein kinase n=1 Tax=Telopea speciosissima TaxID=54955 RepID=UPI001CC7675C|nr:putative serine/threonine-protein kinase [Telopea speciosissima]